MPKLVLGDSGFSVKVGISILIFHPLMENRTKKNNLRLNTNESKFRCIRLTKENCVRVIIAPATQRSTHDSNCSSLCKNATTYFKSQGQVFPGQYALTISRKFCVRLTPLCNEFVIGRLWFYCPAANNNIQCAPHLH